MSPLQYYSVGPIQNCSQGAHFSETVALLGSTTVSGFGPKCDSSFGGVFGRKGPSCRTTRLNKFTEATATKWLQRHIYFGVGIHFLGWKFPVYEIHSDGSEFEVESSGPRVWKTPKDKKRWNPLLEHVKGCFRGVVHSGSTHVPFVTTELDRHSGDVHAETHIRQAMGTARLLKCKFSFCTGYRLNWCVEVNPRNGSVKFFGWGNRPIPTDTAKEIGKQIHETLGNYGLLDEKGKREIFPYNHPQVLLPFRIDKLTIIGDGVLPKCQRKKLDRNAGKMTPYETYSILSFCKWLGAGSNFCEATLLKSLQAACVALPDEPVERKSPEVMVQNVGSVENVSSEANVTFSSRKCSGFEISNSFERQHGALLELCRRLGRIATEQEALTYIQENSLYTGNWEQNCGRRRCRVRWILKRIAETFDPAKCRGVRHDIKVGKFDGWARSHAFYGVKRRDRQTLDEFGNIVETKGRGRIDWRFVSTALSIIEFCLITDPNEDGSLPQARMEDLWSRCCDMPFDDRKWALCRDWLERQGIIKIVDRNWHRGKAMRWAVAVDLDRLVQWWKKKKQPSLLEAVGLREFLRKRNNRDNKALNTYLAQGGLNLANVADFTAVLTRPPP